jgi:hypothetical protein
VTGRHRRGWLDRVPLPLVPAFVVGAPIGVVWLAAGLFLLARLAVRSL